MEAVEVTFKGLKWTRVIALRDYQEASAHTFNMVEDINEGLKKMVLIELEGLP